MKQTLLNYIKNIVSKKTQRKIVVISVDDYGNVRLDSKQARNALDQAGLKVYNRFDAYDTLETKQDLEQLIDVLTSIKDKNGNYAIFTPFSMSCNINFEEIIANNYEYYAYENIVKSFEKLAVLHPNAYDGAWKLMKEAVDNGIIVPQFHGREHLNLRVFNEKLKNKEHELITCLINRSYTSIIHSGYDSISVSAAFNFWDPAEHNDLNFIINDGINRFNEVYGYAPIHFNPPWGRRAL